MKYLLYILILQIFKILSNYTYELIDEMIQKYFIFEKYDFDSFKIFKYIPLCKGKINPIKQVYLQITSVNDMFSDYLYVYDNYSKIEQDKNANFIDYIEKYLPDSNSNSIALNLTCGRDYYFIISIAIKTLYYYSPSPYYQFLIIDAEDDIIKLNPSLSNFLSIEQRKNHNQEIFYYIHNETKYRFLLFGTKAKVKIYKNGVIVFNKNSEENKFEKTIELEKNQNYTIYFDKNGGYSSFIIQFFNESKIFKHNFQNGPLFLYYYKYYFEIDISNYNMNDIILFKLYSRNNYGFKYQYKTDFKGNNFIDLGNHFFNNFIPIKKTKNDTSIIIYIEYTTFTSFFSILYLIPNYKVKEIKEEYNDLIKGPKIYFH